jgi:hypothetical protein
MSPTLRIATLLAPLLAAAMPSQAVAALYREIPVTFTGVVANDVAGSIMIRQPDGSSIPYTGPVPDYPYKKGDTVSISFNTILPTQEYYTDPGYTGQIAADGIYRINVFGPGNTGTDFFGVAPDFDVSGPMTPTSNAGQDLSVNGMTIVYDSNADSYSMDFANSGWIASLMDAPGFLYDPALGTLSASRSTCLGGSPGNCINFGDGGFTLTGGATSAGATIPVYSSDPASYVAGLFNMLFTGTWSLPTFGASSGGGSTGGTEVPEPGMALLFGIGAWAVVARQRKQRPA